MKNLCALIGILIIHSIGYSADTLSSQISKATVFLSGAQVFRETKLLTIAKGVHEYIIEDVSPYLDKNQLQATSKGNFLILDILFKTEHIAPPAIAPTIIPESIQKEMDELGDSLLFLSFEKERIKEKLKNLNGEKTMVLQSQLIKSGGKSDTLPEFMNIVEYYRLKLDDINELIHNWKKQQHYASTTEKRYKDRIVELKSYTTKVKQSVKSPKTRYHIHVTTYAEVATTGSVEVNYFIANAGWTPAYDLRAENTTDPMLITYKANVYQNSGEDWDKVDLILSTYNRTFSEKKPTLGVWRLDYSVNKGNGVRQQYTQNFMSEEEMKSKNASLKLGNEVDSVKESFDDFPSMADINQNFSNVEFDVSLPYSIESNGSHKLMVITHEKVEAKYFHYMLPRMNKNAFLLARIGDWENLSLLPGKANIYFRNTNVGNTYINPSAMADTLELTLGKDVAIVSKRKKVGCDVKKVKMGKRNHETLSFEIEIRNNSRAAIELTIDDQIPITSNEEIEVKLVDGDGGDFNSDNGKLSWEFKLKPGEVRLINFSYSVEHDKDKPVS